MNKTFDDKELIEFIDSMEHISELEKDILKLDLKATRAGFDLAEKIYKKNEEITRFNGGDL